MTATILTFLAFLGIIYGIIAFVQAKLRPNNPPTLPKGMQVLVFSTILFLFLVFVDSTLVKIDGQEVGVVVTPNGVSSEPIHTGWHFIAPWNTVKGMDKTVWVYSLTQSSKEGAKQATDAIWCPTSDGIKMGFDISVNWRIDPEQAPWIYSNISADQTKRGQYEWIEENIIRPAIKSVMPLTVSKYTPIECYSEKRSEIQADVFKQLKSELAKNKLIVENAQIREVYYNPDYETAINQKKLEEQKVLTMVQITRQKEEGLKQSTIDKDIAIQKAEGEAKALQIKGDAINKNPKIVQLEWIQAWSKGGAQVPQVISGSSGNMFMIDLKNNGKEESK